MATIKYLLRSENKVAPIYLRLSINRKQVFKRKTGFNIDQKDWSKSTSMPKQTTPNNKNLSVDLQELSSKILQRLNKTTSSGEEITGHWLQREIDLHFKRISENISSEYVVDAIEEIISSAPYRRNSRGGIGLSTSRINSYKALKRIFKDFQGLKAYKVKEVDTLNPQAIVNKKVEKSMKTMLQRLFPFNYFHLFG